MTNQELFSQAIADAKAVRDAAVANAKAALEETFTPRIMNMLSAKLNELEEEGLEEKVEDGEEMKKEGHEAEIGFGAASQKPEIEEMEEEGYGLEEADLDEILAQLEEEAGEDKVEEAKKKDGEKVEEAKKEDDDDKKKKVEESTDLEEADDDDAKDDDSKAEKSEGDEEVTELTVDELKDIIRDVLSDIMGGEEEAGDDLDIDAADANGEEVADDEESISLDELLAELEKEEGKDKVEEKKEEDKDKVEEAKKDDEKEAKKDKKDLEEAIKTIKILQAELNEVNLLNAKLLYTNKIFKAKSLSEVQKVKVVKSLDKATNVKEAKAIYETLNETFSTKAKSQIKESVGFASKAVGVAPKQPIVESDAAIRRMQQLAGIIK